MGGGVLMIHARRLAVATLTWAALAAVAWWRIDRAITRFAEQTDEDFPTLRMENR